MFCEYCKAKGVTDPKCSCCVTTSEVKVTTEPPDLSDWEEDINKPTQPGRREKNKKTREKNKKKAKSKKKRRKKGGGNKTLKKKII